MHTIDLVKERLNPNLEMEGVVFTMYDARTNLAEAPSYGMPITKYDKRSTGAESYRLLAEEVIHRGEEEWQ